MVWIEGAGPNRLLVKVLIRNDEYQKPAGLQNRPPASQSADRVGHVFQTMTAVNGIKSLGFEIPVDGIGITLVDIEGFCPSTH